MEGGGFHTQVFHTSMLTEDPLYQCNGRYCSFTFYILLAIIMYFYLKTIAGKSISDLSLSYVGVGSSIPVVLGL